jgi:hypothetical protein
MAILNEYYTAFSSIRPPVPTGEAVLAKVHSGAVLTRSLPGFLKIGVVLWFILYSLVWLSLWSVVYREYERWGLIQAFFAQMIALLAGFVVVKVTLLRARHLKALPSDDFVFLRIVAVLCRWVGEVALILVIGAFLSALLSPVSLSLLFLSASGAAPTTLVGLGLFMLALLTLIASVLLFFLMYAVATAIDLMLAIEFNTRAERAANPQRLLAAEPR